LSYIGRLAKKMTKLLSKICPCLAGVLMEKPTARAREGASLRGLDFDNMEHTTAQHELEGSWVLYEGPASDAPEKKYIEVDDGLGALLFFKGGKGTTETDRTSVVGGVVNRSLRHMHALELKASGQVRRDRPHTTRCELRGSREEPALPSLCRGAWARVTIDRCR
jgi:hypothetical protein